MNNYFFSIIIGLVLLTTSCKSTYVGGYSALPNLTMDYNVKTELKVDTTRVLQASSKTRIYFKLIKIGDYTFSDAFGGNVGDREKSAATFKALDGTGNDILINPKYLVKIKRGLFVKEIQATVAGYGAKLYLK
jgi:hypothetical protein